MEPIRTNRFLKGNKRVCAVHGIALSLSLGMAVRAGTAAVACPPYLQLTAPTSHCRLRKTKDIFPASCQLRGCPDRPGGSDSPAVHVFLLLGLLRHTAPGPSAPERPTWVSPVLVSSPLVELGSSTKNTQWGHLYNGVSQHKKSNFNFFFPLSF